MSDLWSILIFGRLFAAEAVAEEAEAVAEAEAALTVAPVTCRKRKREDEVLASPAIINADPVGAEIIAFIANLERIEEDMQDMVEKFSRMRI